MKQPQNHESHNGNARQHFKLSISIFLSYQTKLYTPPTSVSSKKLQSLRMSSESEDTAIPTSPRTLYKDPDDGRQRFLLELEFVQCLANPTYIHYLAQNRYFEDEAFIGYLRYLQYWQRPEYAKFIMYPHCLYFLELLQNANFRSSIAHPGNKELVHRQQFYFWKNYKYNRLKHIISKSQLQAAAATPASVSPPSTTPTAIAVVSPPSTPPTTIAVTAPIDLPESSIAVTSSATATVQEISSGVDR